MYVIERGTAAAWLCTTAIEVFELDAVKLRLQGELKNFTVFEQRLDNWEHISAGVIKIYKCSDVITKCNECTKYTGCEIRLKVIETIKAHSEWVKLVENNGGYTF